MIQEDHKERAKRPDVAKRLANRRGLVEQVVKASLPGRLAPTWSQETRQQLRQELDRWILSTSQITHRLSLIFNRVILFCIESERKWSQLNESQRQTEACPYALPEKFEDAHFTAMALGGMKLTSKIRKNDPFCRLIEDFINEEFGTENFPTITRQRGDCQAIVIAAKRYQTNFTNACVVPFLERQKAYVILWCELNGVEKELSRDILWKINGWKPRNYTFPAFEANVSAFIDDERRRLGNPSNLTPKRLRIPVVLRYYYHILQYYTEKGRGKKFTLAPLCRVKCHFITVDGTVLFEILKNVAQAVCQESLPDCIKGALAKRQPIRDEAVWREVFNYTGLRRRRQFGFQVDTDGVSVCFHFNHTVKAKTKGKRRRERQRKKSQRIIAVDPGRSNIIYAYDPEAEEYFRLTRQEYYRASGMKNRIRREHLRHHGLQGIYAAMSKTPSRSILEADWYQYQQTIVRNYDRMWTVHCGLASRREDFRVYCLKQKCMDKFFNKFIKNGIKPVVAYGAASMNPTGKGELSVPVKSVFKKCEQRFYTVKENEDYSTKMHFDCQRETTAVLKGYTRRTIRGLRWCPTCRKLVSRDKNACKNIAASFVADERPTYLCRTTQIQANTTRRLPGKRLFQGGGRLQRGKVTKTELRRGEPPVTDPYKDGVSVRVAYTSFVTRCILDRVHNSGEVVKPEKCQWK